MHTSIESTHTSRAFTHLIRTPRNFVDRLRSSSFILALLLLLPGISAAAQNVNGACLYALDPTAQQAFFITGNTSVSSGCSIVVESSNNSAFVIGGTETLDLGNHAKVGVVGGWQLNGNTIVDTMSNQQEQPFTISNPGDPLASVSAPTQGTIVSPNPVSYGQSNPPPNNMLSPGVYCGGLMIGNPGGVEYTMSPGTYIIAGGGFQITSSADVVGSGVTIYNTSSGVWGCSSSYTYKPISIDGQAKINLSAPTSGPLAGVVIFGDRNGCATPGSCTDNINGQATATFTGNLYFPSDQLIFNGSSTTGGCMGVVADTITINGHSNFGSQGCSINPISVTVTPATVVLYGGQQQLFSAAVTNTYNTAVSWSISPSVESAGSIDASGMYTAPASISTEQTVTVTATSQADPATSGTTTLTLMPPVPPTISWATPAAITYGTPLSGIQLDATVNAPGTLTYTAAPGTTLTAGTHTLTVTFTPSNPNIYSAATANVVLTVNQVTPVITWASPAAITYGTALSGTQLDATANVPGTLAYSPAAGTVLTAGNQTLVVTFTPTDATDYATTTASVALAVQQATPVITWSTPAAIPYGAALSATQLDATATVTGTFAYSPAAGTVLTAGNQTLSVTFTPTDTTDYATTTASVPLAVQQATPVITWATPAAITYGTALGALQLDATANVPGTFAYSPVGGTVLEAGSKALSTTFTPTDTTDYTTATATVTLAVNQPVCTSNGYSYVRTIVIDHTKVPNTDQVNFPFLFNTTDPLFATTANGGHVQNPNGYDIFFTTDPAGQTKLDYEMEDYNPLTGQVIAWIRIPTLSHTSDTAVYVFYGNSAITTSQQNPTGVWDSNFIGVWHLPNGTILSANDSTANGNNGTVASASATAGEIDGGASFNGSTSSIGFGTNITTAQMNTVSTWAYINTLNSAQELVSHSAVSQGVEVLVYNNSICAYVMGSSTSDVCSTSGAKVPGWNHIVLTQGGPSAAMNLFINGADAGSATAPASISNPPNLDLGFWANAGGRYFNGTLDEVRISSTVRSADWIATEYNNQSSASTFYAVSPENSDGISPGSVSLYAAQSQQFSIPGQVSSGISWSLSTGALGNLTTAGLYTAPGSIANVQTLTVTAIGPSCSVQGSAVVTLLPPPSSLTLSLTVDASSPYVTGTAQSFTATLKDQSGAPVAGANLVFTVAGVNATTGTAVTDITGTAQFTYTGANSGNDKVEASINFNGDTAQSNQVQASWVVPVNSISTTTVSGAFFQNVGPVYNFDTPPSATPAFTQTFPNIVFNPPAGAIPGNTTVNPGTRPFTDVITDQTGKFVGTIVAQGNGYEPGVVPGNFGSFQAVFTGSFVVSNGGNAAISVYVDNTFILGIGGGATYVSGPRSGAPQTTPFQQYPVVGALATSIGGATMTVHFPGPGTYPYELDYVECCGGGGGDTLSLMMTAGAPNGTSGTPPAASLTLSPGSLQPLPVGGKQSFTVLATDATGAPVPNLSVGLVVSYVDSQDLTATTDSTGKVTFQYQDVDAGTASVQAVAIIDGMVTYSNQVSVPWTLPASTTTSSNGTGSTIGINISAQSVVTLPKTLALNGTVTDSNPPVGSTLAITWMLVSGPGTVSFTNPQQAVTTASFSQAGNYVLQLSATDSANSGSVQFPVTVNPEPGTAQGWIGSPANGATVSGVVPITVASGTTLQSGILTYYPANNFNDVVTLNANTTGSGQIGTLDTTTLPNGSYWIQLQAASTSGTQEYSLALVTVAGNYKPGRVTATVTDLVVPANGLAINIQRTYDSLNANTVGDFGYGWTLGTDVNLTIDPKGDVTFTLNGQRKTFFLTPQSGGWFLPYYLPDFTPEPGLHGTLTDSASGCVTDFDFLVPDGSSWACVGGGPYNPPGYVYTDPSGTEYLISASGSLQLVVDKNGNALSITRSGITSSTGLSVSFSRDSQGRITQITDPQNNQYIYTYDSNGNLATVTYPGQSQPSTYSYAANHYYTGGTDALQNPLPSSTYYGPNDTDPNGLPLNGRLESVADALNEATSYAYNLATNTTTITYPPDPSGASGTATMVYDSYGDLVTSTDPLGHTTKNVYDANHNLTSVTDPLQNVTSYTYDSNGNQTSVTYPKTTTSTNTTSRTAYNQFSEPTSTMDELNNVRTFNYDTNYNPLSVTDFAGTLASFLFNPNGTLQAGAVGYDITANPAMGSQFSYDANGNLISRTDALNRITSYTYNSLGQKASMTIPVPAGASASAATTTYGYDLLGDLTNTAAPLGRTTSSTYDSNGNKLTDTDADQHTTSYKYDALNRLIKTTYPDQSTDSRSYDFRNNLVDEIDQSGHDTHYSYDLAGHLASVTQGYGTSNASATTYTYDADGRKLTQADALGHTTSYGYDAAGNLTSVSGPGGNFQYGYDDARDRVSMTDGNGHTTSYHYDTRKRLFETDYPDGTKSTNGYDGPGNLTSVTDQAGNKVQYTYDAANQLQSVVQVNSPNTGNNTTAYGYDPDGNLTALTDANGHTTSNSYDLLYELRTKTLPDGASTETRSYDPAGNLLSLRHFNGYTTGYGYDTLNRLLSRTPDPATGEPTVSFTYTATGKRATMTDASGLTQYTYDTLDRLVTKDTPEGTLSYTYDAAGNLASMTSGDGNVSVSYTWDSLNRLSTVADSRLGTTTYTYDSASNVVTVAYPNGVQSTLNYDQLNRLTSLTTPSTNTGYLYQLGPTGNRTNATEITGRSITWSYDGIYRLTSESIANAPSKANGSASYGIDPVGNRLSENSTISGVNSGSFSYSPDDLLLGGIESYDADGNTVMTGGKIFAYDSEDRLKSMNGGQVTIVYDGDGNRVAKTVNGTTTRYLVDGLNPTGYAQVVEETGATERTYTYGLQRISEDQIINNAWTPSFYGYHGMDSVRTLTNAAGAITDTCEYDAYGNKINSTGMTPNVYMYRGEAYDSDLELYYLRARWMNPLTGRFMSRDPREECGCSSIPDAAKNKYIYASSDPVDRVDPSGRADTVEEEGIIGDIDLQQVGRATVPKGAFWGGIGLTGFGLEIACMYNTEGAGVGVIGQNIGGPQNPKLLPAICSAISSKMPYIPRPGAVPWPFDPDDVRTNPNSGWGCNAALTECTKRCPNGNTSYLHYDPGTKYGEGPHWDYKDCDGKTWKIWPDGTMSPANG